MTNDVLVLVVWYYILVKINKLDWVGFKKILILVNFRIKSF